MPDCDIVTNMYNIVERVWQSNTCGHNGLFVLCAFLLLHQMCLHSSAKINSIT